MVGSTQFSVPYLVHLLCNAKVHVNRTVGLGRYSVSFGGRYLLLERYGGKGSECIPLSPSLTLVYHSCMAGGRGFKLDVGPRGCFFMGYGSASVSSGAVSGVFGRVLRHTNVMQGRGQGKPHLRSLQRAFYMGSFIRLYRSKGSVRGIVLVLVACVKRRSVTTAGGCIEVIRAVFPRVMERMSVTRGRVFPGVSRVASWLYVGGLVCSEF